MPFPPMPFLWLRSAARIGAVRGGLAWLGLAVPLSAQVVVPLSYTATPAEGQAQGGSYNYFDDTGRQLIDGSFGVDNWTADLGRGNAYEWVGWVTVDPTLVFNFSAPVTIGSVTLGFSRHWGAGIFLPGTVMIGSQSFSLNGLELGDFSRGNLTFTLNQPITTNQLTISLFDGNAGRWIFLDEAQFTAVPEPSTLGLLALGAAGLFSRSRRRS